MYYITLEPGDATRYQLICGTVGPKFIFGFGVGDERGRWIVFNRNDIPSFSFLYFRAKLYGADDYKNYNNLHTAQVAFEAFLHIIGQRRFLSDSYLRLADLKTGWLDNIPTLEDLNENE